MHESDIKYFKNILKERKNQIEKNIGDTYEELQGLVNSEVSDELDYATINIDKTIEHAITAQQLEELKDIDYALRKFNSFNYGICEMCEEEIGLQRLKVKPQAKYCIACRKMMEKTSKK